MTEKGHLQNAQKRCNEFGRQLFYSEQHNLTTLVTSRGAKGLLSEDKFSPTPAFSLGEKSAQEINFN